MSMNEFDLTGSDFEPDYEEEPVDLDPAEADALDVANWHLRCISRVRAERDALNAHFEAEMSRLQMRLDSRLLVLAKQESWHTRPVVGLHRALRAADPKRTSITLACGTLRSKAQQPEWEYPDELAFLAWADTHHPELVAPQEVSMKVPSVSIGAVRDALEKVKVLDGIPITITPAHPAKAEVKKVLTKRDAKGNPLAYGLDPATGDIPPGLKVTTQEPDFTVDTSTE